MVIVWNQNFGLIINYHSTTEKRLGIALLKFQFSNKVYFMVNYVNVYDNLMFIVIPSKTVYSHRK